MPTNNVLALEFVQQINRHDVEGIGRLMSDDHVFIDAHGNAVEGKEKMRVGWKHYFEWFPDYRIDISITMEDHDLVLLCGEASASYQGLGNTDAARSWKLPAAWKAIVQSNKIKLWQVFADTKIPFEIIQKYSAAAGGEFRT
ncbi:MAG TPA: nuclear transport factor 2 family protein [Bacteroidota bacterium]|nr:nuclear transport factor 2 family protein [Bacteroidota bacterium]